jgi:hypothetical protein
MADDSPSTNSLLETPGNPQTVGDTKNDLFSSYLNDQPRTRSNPLHAYKSYTYLFTVAPIPKGMYNNGEYPPPGQLNNILIRSQGDWAHAKRATTEFGSYDYYIDNLVITTLIHPDKRVGTVADRGAFTFDVYEPYSCGLFAEAMVNAAQASGYQNMGEAIFLLCIEFAGYTDNDTPIINPDLTRYITFNFSDFDMSVNQAGSIYNVSAIPANNKNSQDAHATTSNDYQIHGITVEDFINKSVKGSLQTAINRAYQELKNNKTLADTDHIEITFPENPNLPNTPNVIGKAKLFDNFNSAGTQHQPDFNKIYDKANKIFKETYNVQEDRVMTIPKGTPILAAIKEVIIMSDYIGKQMEGGNFKADSNGMINWFLIKPRNEYGSYNPQLNRNNMKWIYEIVPYKVHIDNFVPPGIQPPGYDQLKLNIPRTYNYIYTGKNSDVISWQIKYNMTLKGLPADLGTNTANSFSNLRGDANTKQQGKTLPHTGANSIREFASSIALHGMKELLSIGNVGGGTNTTSSMHVRLMDSIVNNANNASNHILSMTIMGDPFWIPNDNTGNYSSEAQDYHSNTDGTVNTYSGEVYILVNFRTPIDIDPETGLYKFAATLDTISGLYMLTKVTHRFEKGRFTQQFPESMRRKAQLTTSSKGSGFGISAGQQGAGGFLAAGATDLISSVLDVIGGKGVFGSGLPIPNVGKIAAGVGAALGNELSGAISDITSDVTEVAGDIGSSIGGAFEE